MSVTHNRLPAPRENAITQRRLPSNPAEAAAIVHRLKSNPDITYLGMDWSNDGTYQVVRYMRATQGQTVNARLVERPAPAPRRRVSRGWIIAGSVLATLAALCGGGWLWVRSMSTADVVMTLIGVVAAAAFAVYCTVKIRGASGGHGGTFSGTFTGTFK